MRNEWEVEHQIQKTLSSWALKGRNCALVTGIPEVWFKMSMS